MNYIFHLIIRQLIIVATVVRVVLQLFIEHVTSLVEYSRWKKGKNFSVIDWWWQISTQRRIFLHETFFSKMSILLYSLKNKEYSAGSIELQHKNWFRLIDVGNMSIQNWFNHDGMWEEDFFCAFQTILLRLIITLFPVKDLFENTRDTN